MDHGESDRIPSVLGIVGRSEVGKTSLILKLIPELAKRGYRVGAVKNCPHGFDLDKEGKDSHKFLSAGSAGVLLTSPERFALIRERERKEIEEIPGLFSSLFYGLDIVLVEGLGNLPGMKRIELLRKGISDCLDPTLGEIVAVVSDVDVSTDTPVFRPNEVSRITDFLEEVMQQRENTNQGLEILVNGEKLLLNNFVQGMVKNMTLAMVESLRRKSTPESIRKVVIKVDNA